MNRTEDCKHFELHLVDLAYGDLPEAKADALRLHGANCPSCRSALEDIMLTRKLAAQLPLLEPDGDMDAAVLDAAHAHIAEQRAKGDGHQDTKSVSPTNIWHGKPTFGERLRSFLLAPALATTALAGLVLVLSLFLSKGQNINVERLDTENAPIEEKILSEKKTEQAEGPHTPVSPTGEMAERLFAQPPPSRPPPQGSGPKAESRRGAANSPVDPKSHAEPVASLGTRGPSPAESFSYSRRKKARPSKSRSSGRKKIQDIQEFEDRFSSPPASQAARSRASEAPSAAPSVQGSADQRAPKAGQVAPLDSATPSAFQRGMDAYARGDCSRAIDELQQAASLTNQSKVVATALLHIARCEKRRGRFGAAVPWYKKFLTRFPSHRDRPSALWEAAACHRRLGQVDTARILLEELSRSPRWKTRSQKELEELAPQKE